MVTPGSILPTRQHAPGVGRPAAPPEPVQPDESLHEGALRRFRDLRSDLRRPEERNFWIATILLTTGLIYSYWPGLMNARASWANPQYSHGWLVPLCSLALIFWWRRPARAVSRTEQLIGLGIIAVSMLIRLVCANFRIVTLDMYTFVPALAGIVLLTGGWHACRWAWPPIAALFFMYPLPDEATRYLLGPLQTLATRVSTFALQTLGLDAFREGNRIVLGEDHVLGVVDACSGLRMLTIFVWLSLMIALVSGGEWWANLLILASSIPIALAVNSIRITVTGLTYTFSPEMAEKIFHDWAGYFMMPLALAMLFGLQRLLSMLVIEDEWVRPAVALSPQSRFGPAVVSGGPKPQEIRQPQQRGRDGGN